MYKLARESLQIQIHNLKTKSVLTKLLQFLVPSALLK
jgi:hypothetical protein